MRRAVRQRRMAVVTEKVRGSHGCISSKHAVRQRHNSPLLVSCGSPPQSLSVSARFDCIGLHVREGKARREAEKG